MQNKKRKKMAHLVPETKQQMENMTCNINFVQYPNNE